jgi:hypothetical protein
MECSVIRIPRWLVAILGLLFGLLHAGLGFASLNSYADPTLAITSILIYIVSIVASMVFYRGPDLPMPQAIFNLAVAALVPLLTNHNLDPKTADMYSTWYVIGIATLMATTAVRQQKFIAWLGTAILVFQVISWAGLIAGIQTGLIGALMLVFSGHTISVGLRNAYRDTMAFTKLALDTQTEKVVNAASSQERRARLDSALKGALPMLNIIKSSHGKLTEGQKQEARLLEASLRDEIRGRGLMTNAIRDAVKNARLRGIEVVLLDEGGLDQLTPNHRSEILAQVAESIAGVKEGRITLRAPADEAWRVTLVATRAGIAKPDVWLKF